MKSWKSVIGALACVALCGSLTACRTEGLGKVPPKLVELYDQGAPAGVLELEISRSGSIAEMEVDIPVEALPEAVRKAAEARAPGAVITGAEREIQLTGDAWEVKLRHEERDWEFVIDGSGAIRETEKELRREETPEAVLSAAAAAVPGAEFKSVELIEHGPFQEYHVKQTKDGASYKVVLSPDGKVKRAVREARAEIEIPLKQT
ncbi:MAG: hypothetical protein HY812_06925 [Planctomycetes bacterium]|nr:hypothetical protein [Planctomycetota bacterium]